MTCVSLTLYTQTSVSLSESDSFKVPFSDESSDLESSKPKEILKLKKYYLSKYLQIVTSLVVQSL